jgi:CRP-like cAMP-binding protein
LSSDAVTDIGVAAAAGRAPTASFLDRLDAEQRAALLALGHVRRYPAQSIIFFEGDDAHDVVLIQAGDLKISATVEDREVVLDVLGPGDILGEVAAIDGLPRSATLTTLTLAEVLRIPAAAFMDHLATHPASALVLMGCLAARVRDTSRRQVEYGALDAVGRVCRRLVELMDRYGRPTPDGVTISGPLTQGEIAAWAGLSREAVVKALQGLRALGWVATTPRSITVVDVDAVTFRASLTIA